MDYKLQARNLETTNQAVQIPIERLGVRNRTTKAPRPYTQSMVSRLLLSDTCQPLVLVGGGL